MTLTIEKSVGKIDNKARMGGRIDIYLEDNMGKTLSIENKIYAGDQLHQIERYVNHNANKNAVVYLNLWGADPSKESAGKLKSGNQFQVISYSNHIIDWLELCIKEVYDQTILREAIRQYQYLIKILTNQTLSKEMSKKVEELIKENYESAVAIQSNLMQVELRQTEIFLDELRTHLLKQFGSEDWSVWFDKDLSKSWTGLSIKHKSWDKHFNSENKRDTRNEKRIRIKLEGHPKLPWSISEYGINTYKTSFSHEKIRTLCEGFDVAVAAKSNDYWPYFKPLLDLSTPEKRARLYDEKSRKDLLIEVGNKLFQLASDCKDIFAELKPLN